MDSLGNSQISVMSSEVSAYISIRSLILSRKFYEGYRLTYTKLTKELNMSKTPIVSALSRLVQESLVEHKYNSGYTVARISGGGFGQAPGLEDTLNCNSTDDYNREITPPSVSLNQTVYNVIKDYILKSKFVPGQKLVYTDLEEKFGVSKTPIINALSQLESEGYVRLKRNSGYYVREVTFKEVEDLLKARETLELANLDLVLAMHTQEDLRDLERIHQEHIDYPPPTYDDIRVGNNRRFHLRIAAMGRNSLMIKYISHLYDFFDLRMKFSLSFLSSERLREADVEHGQIVAALRERNKSLLKKVFRRHLTASVKDILRHIKENQG